MCKPCSPGGRPSITPSTQHPMSVFSSKEVNLITPFIVGCPLSTIATADDPLIKCFKL